MTLNRFVLILSIVATSVGAQAAKTPSAVDQLYAARQYELADAYWAAGQKFVDLGQADRGAEFKARAKQIFPGYVPGQTPEANAAAPARPEPQLPTLDAVLQKNLQGEKIARLQFQKLLRGYLTGNAATVASALADTVVVDGKPAQPTAAAVATFLEAHPAEAGSPEDLFELDSLETSSAGQTVTLTVKPNPQAPGGLGTLLSFWKPQQTYSFDRSGDTWKLTAISGE